jgi:hypothetical protein
MECSVEQNRMSVGTVEWKEEGKLRVVPGMNKVNLVGANSTHVVHVLNALDTPSIAI